jgi:ribosomal protein S18 acetylase RimI-like enzyme
MSKTEITIYDRRPTVDEFNFLRKLAGWPVMPEVLVETGLKNTLFAVIAQTHHQELVGMGRVVGDGAIYFHISDVIVHPNYQKMGIGSMIMTRLMELLATEGGPNTNIGLMCSKGREEFYKQFGFIERPSDQFGAGMIIVRH